MIQNQILCLGLSRLEFQTLYCSFPLTYEFYKILPAHFDTLEQLQEMISQSVCLFINPKKLTLCQLQALVEEHKFAARYAHAAILLFTAPFTKEQRCTVDTKALLRVDLKTRFNRTLDAAVRTVRKATLPSSWSGMEKMEANMFNDGWYLLDLETDGTDPLAHQILSISIAYMANYEIKGTQTLYIKPDIPISEEVENLTGITNAVLAEKGITRQEAVDFLNTLSPSAPIVLEQDRFYRPFLRALYRSCGQKFDLPHIMLDSLFSIAFGHLLPRCGKDVLKHLTDRKYPRTPVPNPYLAELYDLTLAVFENLQDRYDVRAPGHFPSLYFIKNECDD